MVGNVGSIWSALEFVGVEIVYWNGTMPTAVGNLIVGIGVCVFSVCVCV